MSKNKELRYFHGSLFIKSYICATFWIYMILHLIYINLQCIFVEFPNLMWYATIKSLLDMQSWKIMDQWSDKFEKVYMYTFFWHH